MYTVPDSQAKTAVHAVLAAVLQVRDCRLQALLWQRARDPYAGMWALPGGVLEADETLEESMRRHLATSPGDLVTEPRTTCKLSCFCE